MKNSQRAEQALRAIESPADGKIDVTAQILSFDPGLYSVDIYATQTIRGVSGMVVPCIRLDPIHAGDQGRAFVSTLTDSPLTQPGDQTVYLRVQGARANVLLTIYKLAGSMTSPELRISSVQGPGMQSAPAAEPAALTSEKLGLVVHVERTGDIAVQAGVWAGRPGSGHAIEGMSIKPEVIALDEIEYQAVLGSDWTTPWLNGGEFCGSRGLSLPLLGARIRLRGAAAKSYNVTYWGSFIGTGERGPVADGAVCSAGGAALEALRVVLTPQRSSAAAKSSDKPPSAASTPIKGKGQSGKQAVPVTPPVKSGKAAQETTTAASRFKLPGRSQPRRS